MKLIPLTKGLFAKVDDEDYEHLMQFKWQAAVYTYGTYAQRTCREFKKVTIKMHRQILKLSDNKMFCDHVNHNGLDNQKSNLRIATASQNNSNRTSIKNSSSKHLGVTHRTDKRYKKIKHFWVAQIRKNGTTYYLDTFPFTEQGEIDAAKAYDKAAKEIHGEFANLNFKE